MTSLPQVTAPGYQDFLEDLKRRVRTAQVRAAVSVNRELVLLYWEIGREISTRMAEHGWGGKVVDQLAADLRQTFPEIKGFSPRNLRYMRTFAEVWPDSEILQQLVAKIPWGHHVRILDKARTPEERSFYVAQALEHGWSRNVLVTQIERGLYQRQGTAPLSSQTRRSAALTAPARRPKSRMPREGRKKWSPTPQTLKP